VTDERRQSPRREVPLECVWEGNSTRVSDLSLGGCYIESPYRTLGPSLKVGAETQITLLLADGPIRVRGEVVLVEPGMGLAMRFEPLDPAVAGALQTALDTVPSTGTAGEG